MRLTRFAPLVLLAAAMLAACTAAELAPHPAEARLGRAALTVMMTNGTSCRANLVGPAPWSGSLPECGLGFAVTPSGQGSAIRLAFDQFIAAIRAGDILAPMAAIRLTDAEGQTYDFSSPVPLDE